MGSPLPDAMKPDMPAEEVTLTYHDGTSRTVYDTGIFNENKFQNKKTNSRYFDEAVPKNKLVKSNQ